MKTANSLDSSRVMIPSATITSPTKFHTSSTASHIIEKTAVDKPNKQSENSAPDNKIDLALTNQEVAKSDSQIIFALDKLVALKQAGHVTEAEFEHAKAKLLQDLIDH